jgi:hypothetical protein
MRSASDDTQCLAAAQLHRWAALHHRYENCLGIIRMTQRLSV